MKPVIGCRPQRGALGDNMRHVELAICFFFGLTTVVVSGAVKAQSVEEIDRPAVVERVFQCRTITEPTDRLACFDRETAAMEEAEKSEDLIIADREKVEEAKRGLFGLSLPKIKLFSSGDKKDEVREIETTIASAKRNGRGKMMLVLEDGARWIQTDSTSIPRDPAKGDVIKIKSGAIGSFFAKIGSSRSFRVRRIN